MPAVGYLKKHLTGEKVYCTIRGMDFLESDNFNAEEIAEEAEHLRAVIEMMHEQIALYENDDFEYRTVNFYDDDEVEEYRREKFAHDERKRDARILRRSLGTPYFARMKLNLVGRSANYDDRPSMTRRREIDEFDGMLGDEADIYVGANIIVWRDRIIVFSHNSPLGNKVYDRFENGTLEFGGYEYKVVFRRKFDIREGKLEGVFQDYSSETGGIVYDKFLAHMMKVRRGDKRLTDIIPTIQANQNSIIIRPADENCVVEGCAGCGKTMLLLQRLEYLSFNKKIELDNALIIAPSERYIEHIQPVVDDLMINAARRITMGELYRELLLSMRGIKAAARKAISSAKTVSDEYLPTETVAECYGDGIKRRLISALSVVKNGYRAKMREYRESLEKYEREAEWSRYPYGEPSGPKPKQPVVAIDLDKFAFLPKLGDEMTECKLYLLLTAYCYVLGKPDFSKALFIDEGQDYFINEYRLLAECTQATVNVYGDINQQPIAGRGLVGFSSLGALWETERYSLNENYRNAREITEFVNAALGMNVTSLGLEGGRVERISEDMLPEKLAEGEEDDRVAVIYPSGDTELGKRLLSLVPPDRLYTVVQCKGMEYERVYAVGKMTRSEKYIAYTRALDRLFICE